MEPQLPHLPVSPGTHWPGFEQRPAHLQSLPHISTPQLPTPHGRVDPGVQAPWFSQTPLQPQVVAEVLHFSVPQRPQARVAPGAHWPSPPHALHAQVAPQVWWPQLPQAIESPGLQVPSLRQVASQWQLGSQT